MTKVPSDRYICEATFFVRYAETDQMGIVHHSNYLVYCEELRSQYARDMGSNYADFERLGLALAVSEVNLRFLSPALYGQRITIRGWVEELKSRRITFGYQIVNTDNGQVYVAGTTKHICVDREGKVARIPEDWVKMWEVRQTS
ncbi:MAG: acyl-CoA thioesterase [Chloroflexi bacterium]|nr:acyl-CoA thioesterase [Chloroflexota bacterium]